jgi:hypothetical protein
MLSKSQSDSDQDLKTETNKKKINKNTEYKSLNHLKMKETAGRRVKTAMVYGLIILMTTQPLDK